MDRDISFESATGNPVPRVQRTNHLLAIGINSYRTGGFPNLENARGDAETLVKLLTERYQFEAKHQTLLLDSQATRRNIIKALDRLETNLKASDNLLIFFAGHGYFRQSMELGYLLPADAKKGDYSSFLPNSTLRDYIRGIDAHHTLLVVDSCFSGSLFREVNMEEPASLEAYARQVDKFPSRWGMAAGRIEKVSDGLVGDHSPFAKSLLTYLEKNESPRLPVSELLSYVSKVTTYNAEQTPIGGVLYQTQSLGGQFVFDLREKSRPVSAPSPPQKQPAKPPVTPAVLPPKAKAATKPEAASKQPAARPKKQVRQTEQPKAEPRSASPQSLSSVNWGARLNKFFSSVTNLVWVGLVGLWLLLQAFGVNPFAWVARQFADDPVRGRGVPYQPATSGKPAVTQPDGVTVGVVSPALLKQKMQPELVAVKGGTFGFGALDRSKGELLSPLVSVGDFSIGKYPVTNAQYAAFLNLAQPTQPQVKQWLALGQANGEQGGSIVYQNGRFLVKEGKEQAPVGFVSFAGAWQMAQYLNEQTGQSWRLPSEAEWEFAARAGGKSGEIVYVQSRQTRAQMLLKPETVTALTANELGIYGMVDMGWEWTMDHAGGKLSSIPTDGTPFQSRVLEERQRHIVRGYFPQVKGGAKVRQDFDSRQQQSNLSFRLLREN